jgi:VWFA-related protein
MFRALVGAGTVLVSGAALAAIGQRPQFHSHTDLVSIYATVVDRDGRLVTDLTARDFEVYDEGRRQPLVLFADDVQPITIVIMLDRSGSMSDKHDLVRDAAGELVARLLRGDRARIGSFGRSVAIAPAQFTGDRGELLGILRHDLQDGGPTPLWEAASAAMDALAAETGRRVVLLFSDGKNSPTFSQADIEFDDVRDRARREDVMVYAVGLGSDCDTAPAPAPNSRPDARFQGRGGPTGRGGRIGGRPPTLPGIPIGPGGIRLPRPPPVTFPPSPPSRSDPPAPCRPVAPAPELKALAAEGGGGYFQLEDEDDLGATFSRVADELHRQYLLAFAPSSRDGRLHRLRVRVRGSDLSVRARASYLAPAAVQMWDAGRR